MLRFYNDELTFSVRTVINAVHIIGNFILCHASYQ